jgi:subtilisin family serine protease
MYRLVLKDKGNSPFSIHHPQSFLSQKSIDRRIRQGLTVDEVDLPIDPNYFEAIKATGADIQTFSKWVNTIVVHLTDTQIIPELEKLPFVDSLYCVWRGVLPMPDRLKSEKDVALNEEADDINSYGVGYDQINMNNGRLLHNAGFYGKGITIAVIDGGFTNADIINYWDWNKIVEVKNFNHEITNPLREGTDHGTRVLSCLLSNKWGEMVGTAPEANYYLLRSEIASEEFPVEEDYWISALEYADSVGVDIVNASLGYTVFYESSMNHTLQQLDGQTVPMSRAAALAASRGLLLFNSAGNDGDKEWRKISFPADAENILTVGSLAKDSLRSDFSAVGYTEDGRIKPDLMAMGSMASVVTSSGNIIRSSGTSFSSPILAGLGACLWEALPDLTAVEMLQLLRESGHRFHSPDSLYGYGIADVFEAYTKKTNLTGIRRQNQEDPFSLIVYNNRLYINTGRNEYAQSALNVYSGWGVRMLSVSNLSGSINISSFPRGVYIVQLQIGGKRYVRKFVKI